MAEANGVVCILLAAGLSARMGCPKLLLPLGERTLFEIALASHLASSLDGVCAVVPGWLSGFREAARRHAGARLKLVELKEPCLMSGSLKAGWAWVGRAWRPDGVMISLADKPLVTAGTIDRMIAAFRAAVRPICVPVHGGRRGHPVVISSQLGPEVMALEGDRGAGDVLAADASRVEEVQVESDGVILDIDTAEDLAALRTRLGLDG